jgi:multiple sugar transport system permease protein
MAGNSTGEVVLRARSRVPSASSVRDVLRRPNTYGWALIAPALVILAGLSIFPAGYLLYKSLFNSTLLGSSQTFVGLDNYRAVFESAVFRHDLLITVPFVLAVVSIEMVIGMLLAVPLAKRTAANSIGSTLMLLPFAITPVVSGLNWRQLQEPNLGWVNYYAQKIGLMGAPVEWLSGTGTSWLAVIALDVWQWTPFVALILMAGLQGVPDEPREAATVDGASGWQTFRHITLPLLRPFIAIAFLLRLLEAFKTFGTVEILTGGGPGNSTEIVNLAIYRVALEDFNIGSAAALGIVFVMLLALIVPLALRVVIGRQDLAEEI